MQFVVLRLFFTQFEWNKKHVHCYKVAKPKSLIFFLKHQIDSLLEWSRVKVKDPRNCENSYEKNKIQSILRVLNHDISIW